MNIQNIAGMSGQELMDCVKKQKNEIAEKQRTARYANCPYVKKNGDTEPSFAIGANSYTIKEWDNLIGKVDKTIEEIKKEQEMLEKENRKKDQLASIYENESKKSNYFMDKINGTYKNSAPYDYLAKDGVISYKGVNFVCDYERNAICLGDVSDKSNVITIPLSEGGSLMVNRENLGDLSKAITMFSPEDIKRIMKAIADDNKAQEVQNTIEDEKNSIGAELTAGN